MRGKPVWGGLVALCALAACGERAMPRDDASSLGDGTIDGAIDGAIDDAIEASVACPSDQVSCNGACVDTQTNGDHCGSCSRACPLDASCRGGDCVCRGALTFCGGRCVDVTSDGLNCGACGARCGFDEQCTSGRCECTVGRTRCGLSCVDTRSDRDNCGACGVRCAFGCSGGRCAIAARVWTSANATVIATPSRELLVSGRTFASVAANVSRLVPLFEFSGFAVNLDSVSVGAGHVCAVDGNGRDVRCAGLDNFFQASGSRGRWGIHAVQSVSAGGFHTCLLEQGDAVWCWGANGSGQLGVAPSVRASAALSFVGASMVSAGAEHTCYVASGAVWCAGLNRAGQLGVVGPSSATAVRVQGLSGTIAGLSSGGTASCVWTTAGLVQCWGGNAFAELGDGGAAAAGATRTLSELAAVTQVSVGGDGRASHACALAGGAVHCWGANESGQTGDVSTLVRTPRPRRVEGLPADVTSVATGRAHTCALSPSTGVWCWGNNDSGQLADGTTTSRATPRLVQRRD